MGDGRNGRRFFFLFNCILVYFTVKGFFACCGEYIP